MRVLYCFAAFLFLTLQCSVVFGQSCAPFEKGESIKCDNQVEYYVLLQVNETIDDIHKEIRRDAFSFSAVVPYTCRQLGIKLLCAGSFIECLLTPNGTFLGALPPCRDLCYNMVDECRDFFEANGLESQLPNCTAIPPSPICNNGSQFAVPYYPEDCPYPLKYDYSDNDDADLNDALNEFCVYPCPDPQFTYDEYQGGWGVAYAIGFISVFSGLFLIITWTLSPLKRRYPSNLILWLGICATGVSFSQVLPVFWGGSKEIICTWDDPPRKQYQDYAYDNNGQGVGCVLQGMLLVYSALGANFWWVAICFNLFEIVVLEIDRTWIRVMHKLYHIIAWGWPGATVIILLSASRIGVSLSNGYCFISAPNDRHESEDWVYGLYFSLSAPTLILGTILVCMVVGKVIYLKIKLGNKTTINFLHILRLFLLVGCYWFILTMILIYFIYGSAVGDSIEQAIKDQVACSARTQTHCSLEKRQEYALWWLNIFSIASAGAIVFVTLGLTKETFMFWYRLFKGLWNRDLSIIWQNVTQEVTVGPSAGESDASGSESVGTNGTNGSEDEEELESEEDEGDDGEEGGEMDEMQRTGEGTDSNQTDSEEA